MVLGVKNPPATVGDARDAGSIPGLDRSPGEGNGNSPQDSFFFFLIYLFVFLAVLGLCCCTGFSLVVESWGCHPGVAHEFLTAVASLSPGLRACAL